MKLAFKKSGSGKPLIILHGLYGSSDSWHTIGRMLSENFEVYLVDQRNHGKSPHDPVHTYDKMCDDLYEFFINHHINEAILLGHSMGGKTAMLFTVKYREMVDRLVVVDISPADYGTRDYTSHSLTHEKIISALQLIDTALIQERKEADQILQTVIPQQRIRQFLLKNLKQSEDGNYHWSLNLDALAINMENLAAGILPHKAEYLAPVQVPALFIKGEDSGYIREEDTGLIRRIFPLSRVVSIASAGHWVHVEQPSLFLKTVLDFIISDHQKI